MNAKFLNNHHFNFSKFFYSIEKSFAIDFALNSFGNKFMFVIFNMSIFYSMKSNFSFSDQILFSKNCPDSKNAKKFKLNPFDRKNLLINFDEFLSYQKKINFLRIYASVKIIIGNMQIFMKRILHMRLSKNFDLHNIDQLSC